MRLLLLSILLLASVAFSQFDNPGFVGKLNRGSQSTLLNGLVAYYKMEEASGERVDIVNAYNFTPSGTINQESGKIDYAAGNTGVSGKLTNNYGAELNPSDMTISFWYFSTVAPNPTYFMVNGHHINDGSLNYYIKRLVNSWSFKAGSEKAWPSVVTTNSVFHICFVYTASNTNVVLYTNGVLCGTASTTPLAVAKPNVSTAFNLMGSYNTFDQHNGWMDEFALWNRALTTNEIISGLYNAGSGRQHPFTGF